MHPGGAGLKRLLAAGAVLGALLAIGISLSMDMLYADALQGTWRDAIVHDLKTFFSMEVSREGLVVSAVYVLILFVLGSFGALLGLFFAFFVYKFLDFLKNR